MAEALQIAEEAIAFMRHYAVCDEDHQSRSRKSAQDDKWSFCLTAGTLLPANQERP